MCLANNLETAWPSLCCVGVQDKHPVGIAVSCLVVVALPFPYSALVLFFLGWRGSGCPKKESATEAAPIPLFGWCVG